MDIFTRTKHLSSLFSYDRKVSIDRMTEIIPFCFTQMNGNDEIGSCQQQLHASSFCSQPDHSILENKKFVYLVFTPKQKEPAEGAILLLHGLNERSWEKYLTWAEQLVLSTGKPVILFPIAFHMNRTPSNWFNARTLFPYVKMRRQVIDDLQNSTFLNLALSTRLSDHPLRFYASGRESVYNLWQLIREIKTGHHPLFKENAQTDIFAYSIGALLGQVMIIANPDSLLNESRLFMFCGGSIFSYMNGNARDIMDQEAYNRVKNYFQNDFIAAENGLREGVLSTLKNDFIENAFRSMILPDKLRDFRESFFKKASQRIRSISLLHDKVIPTAGIIKAMGKSSKEILTEEDLPYSYSHQMPFPLEEKDHAAVNRAFGSIFDRAAAFLA